MKKNLLLLFGFLSFSLVSTAQTPITNNTDQTIAPGNSVTCNAGGIPDENRFFHTYDLQNYPSITDTAFFVRMYVAVETTAGGAYNVVGRMHSHVGTNNLANLTLIVADTVAVTPDAGPYYLNIPFGGGYALPNDSIAAEYYLPIGTTASFYPGSTTTAGSGATYIVASACGITDLTDIAGVGFPNMHLILTVYVNQKPVMTGFTKTVVNNSQIDFVAADFTSEFTDNDGDGLTMIKVVSLPSNGVLDLSGSTLVVGDTILDSELATLAYIPNPGYVGSESFSFVARDSSHWSNTPCVVDVTVTAFDVAIGESELHEIQVYPNPTSDKLTLQTNDQITEVRIYSAEGKLVSTDYSGQKEIEVSTLGTGTYLIEVVTDKGTFSNQFVVK